MFEKYRKVNVYIGKTKLSISVRIIVQNFEAPFGAFLSVGPMTDFCSQSLRYYIILYTVIDDGELALRKQMGWGDLKLWV